MYKTVEDLVLLISKDKPDNENFGFPRVVPDLPDKMDCDESDIDGVDNQWFWVQENSDGSYFGETAYALRDGWFLIFTFSSIN